jgi:thimet oligopeptidase
MERDDVITFFHEYGHLIHGIMKGSTQWAQGDLENDFIEAPSQMFEEWPQDPAILQTFARHYQTDQPIPVELAEKARAADKFGRALDVRTQMFYAAISLDFYNRDPQGLAWIIHEVSSQKRKDALKGMMNTGFRDPAFPFGASIA